MIRAVLVPGFNGTARQPLLVKLIKRLKPLGISGKAITVQAGRPTPELLPEIERLAAHQAEVLIGRSFGGRVCARLAVERPPRALVLLGFPIRPPGKRRPLDEAALEALTCPTLIIQGSQDELGSPAVLRRLTRGKSNVTLAVLEGAGHSFGSHEAGAIETTALWLSQRLTPWVKGLQCSC